ncbi:tRNA nucleotidyltransferase/poly(A) polymerase family protein [Leptolyngbya boryana NIES-2135]|uniref:tRNA nucleotidyltransferase/poly(A) polymerase family protein n=1 Tax=Leptolyngbya boryana NIES-2135 TaxID=1973484 RepID=A0A1Z4JER4_LEPBY|nr:CCA tRNA nucleotidyltransferase [Leptolyngbya boryana]ULP31875.1 CCA tRNA nucleotidyltransferase [Leptolyngbya boryana IU 594]BAS58703.1 tRNA nucleotidyltransferase/poly(A) polymerase [Leptolyngbya boryana IAM M-101]BAS65051.1 tRNA nucleotidyltransferase/poly(A) polymerase [Leptolyngbya boryana dg5]BAY54967.1 tRNA nucleotidyltransferase/poly(A) polymerase family protein [Leptolyngbya boryana NIES-2135]
MNLQLEHYRNVALVSSALSPETWPFSLKWLPDSACLVGGTVRDALLDRHSEYLDLDFVLPSGAVETAQAIARHYRAGFVVLDAERQIARVVFEQGTADFAQQVGATLEDDLRRRDFTVNAIAYNPHTKDLLDPLHGYEDLQRKRLRMVSIENLAEDPLRLLRAYRQAAQLGFSLEPETQQAIRHLAPNLSKIAAERVQSELNYLLGSARGTGWIKTACEDGLLQDWLPSATIEHLTQVGAIDDVTVHIQENWTEFWSELSRTVRGTPQASEAKGSVRTWVTIAKLASLLPEDPALAEAQLWRLKYSRAEIQAVSTVVKALPHLRSPEISNWSRAEQYQFFQSIGAVFPAIALLGLAMRIPVETVRRLVDRFLDPTDPVAHPHPILTGQDLMTGLRIPPSPQIGRLLAALQLARAEGKITNREEALAFAQTLL